MCYDKEDNKEVAQYFEINPEPELITNDSGYEIPYKEYKDFLKKAQKGIPFRIKSGNSQEFTKIITYVECDSDTGEMLYKENWDATERQDWDDIFEIFGRGEFLGFLTEEEAIAHIL